MNGLKIRLYPNKEQETLFFKSIGCYRYIYNWGLSTSMKYFEETGKSLSTVLLGKTLTQFKKQEEVSWLKEISNASLKEALRDLGKAYSRFFATQKVGPKYTPKTLSWAKKKGITLGYYHLNGHPKFKKKKDSKLKYYCRYDSIHFTDTHCNIEKIGKLKYKSSYDIDLSSVDKFSNPRVEFVNNKWILSFGIEESPFEAIELSNISLGIDIGIKDLAICSEQSLNAKNINKSATVRKLKKKHKRLQKQSSRKYLMNGSKTQNNIKLEKKLRKIQTRLNNIRLNHVHQVTSRMVKTKPYRIVIEDLNVKGMMSNKHLARAVAEQGFRRFRDILTYKCERLGIKLVLADRWYPSSKTCSSCGHIKKDLKLKDRVYNCPSCSLKIDRDFNAALNLSRYGLEVAP